MGYVPGPRRVSHDTAGFLFLVGPEGAATS